MRKKCLSVLLALAMVLTLLPATALAEGKTIYVNAAAEGDTADTYKTLQAAITAASAGDTIELASDLEIAQQITITQGLTIDGKNYTITVNISNGDNAIGINGCAGAAIKNVNIVAGENAANPKHGINVYKSTGVVLENVSVSGMSGLGLLVNASQVTATGTLKLADNGWGNSINVGFGKNITDWKQGSSLDATAATLVGVDTIYADSGDVERASKEGGIKIAAPTGVVVTVENAVAKVRDWYFATLPDAIAAAQSNDTVTLLKDSTGGGVGTYVSPVTDVNGNPQIPVKNFTLDLNGHSYTVDTPAVGSKGYETQAFHLEKGAVVNIKNGTITSTGAAVKMLVQNYCDLTLENVTLDGTKLPSEQYTYTMSNNHGNVQIKNSRILATENGCAFDVYYWPKNGYGDGITVTVSGDSVINGRVEYGSDGTETGLGQIADKAALVINGGTFEGTFYTYELGSRPANISITGGTFSADPTQFLAEGYKVREVNGTYSVVPQNSIIITFDSKGGSSVAPVATNAEGKLTTLPVPVLSGYVFSGWYTEAGVQVTADTVFTADTTVTAQWTYVPPYTPPTTGGTGGTTTGGSQTVTNPDGSTTTTVTKPDGTVTVTDKDTQGNVTETVSKPDGTSTTTVTNTNGSSSVTTVGQTGKVEAQVSLSQSAVNAAGSEAVALPMAAVPVSYSQAAAPVVTVDLPAGTASAKVEVPVTNATAGTVAILVKADGTQEIVKTSVTTADSVTLTVEDGAKVMIVDNSKDFADVPASYWGSDAVDFATSRDLFNGTSATTFAPDAEMNRAMIVTVLARLDGVDTSAGSSWYETGRQWAIDAGISDGSDMDQNLTREQLATMLYRYAGSPAVSGAMTGFADTASVSTWASDAMTWAVSLGIINGMDGSLNPQGEATRAQVATMLMRFVATL